MTLAGAGLARGLDARSPGEYRIRFAFRVPPSWRLQRWPELRLLTRAAETALLDRVRSTLEVRLNRQPLGTWDLQGIGHDVHQVAAKIPEHFWSEEEWVFDISASLSPTDIERCAELRHGSLWLQIQPDSYLSVPRREPQFNSIATFYAQDRSVQVEIASAFEGGDAANISQLLAPLRGPFEVVARCSGPCMSVQPVDERRHYLLATDDGRWSDELGTLRIPMIERRGALLALEGPDRLAAHVVRDGRSIVPIDLADLTGPRAVAHPEGWRSEAGRIDGWQIVRRRRGLPGGGQYAPFSQANRRRLGFDLTWLFATMMLTALLLLWAVRGLRRRRPSPPPNALAMAEQNRRKDGTE